MRRLYSVVAVVGLLCVLGPLCSVALAGCEKPPVIAGEDFARRHIKKVRLYTYAVVNCRTVREDKLGAYAAEQLNMKGYVVESTRSMFSKSKRINFWTTTGAQLLKITKLRSVQMREVWDNELGKLIKREPPPLDVEALLVVGGAVGYPKAMETNEDPKWPQFYVKGTECGIPPRDIDYLFLQYTLVDPVTSQVILSGGGNVTSSALYLELDMDKIPRDNRRPRKVISEHLAQRPPLYLYGANQWYKMVTAWQYTQTESDFITKTMESLLSNLPPAPTPSGQSPGGGATSGQQTEVPKSEQAPP